MSTDKRPQEQKRLHLRNKNLERYDLDALIKASPALKTHVKPNKYDVKNVYP
jgi:23S rRNA (adenine1618-N6)-methyltransferase